MVKRAVRKAGRVDVAIEGIAKNLEEQGKKAEADKIRGEQQVLRFTRDDQIAAFRVIAKRACKAVKNLREEHIDKAYTEYNDRAVKDLIEKHIDYVYKVYNLASSYLASRPTDFSIYLRFTWNLITADMLNNT